MTLQGGIFFAGEEILECLVRLVYLQRDIIDINSDHLNWFDEAF